MSTKKLKNYLILFSIIFIGGILRLYNINFDDLWSDEMISYWLSDPSRNFEETIKLIFESNLMVTYELGLRYFHFFFGYNFEISRYFSAILGVLSLIMFSILINTNSSFKSVLFGTLLLAINIYHIKYSVELRSYILTFLLCIILLHLIFSNSFERDKVSFLRGTSIFFISIMMLFSHSFSIVVIFSINIYFLIKFFYKKKLLINQLSIIIAINTASIIFLFYYLQNISHTPYWIENVNLSFFTNFYFSKFFGSRIVGLCYILILIYLICIQIKVLKKLDINFFFLVLIFFSYFLPISYSFIFNPILIDRYIFFVLIPILYLISNLVFLINSNKVRYTLISILISITLLNHILTENTFKQFYTEIFTTKPDVKKVFNMINKQNIGYFTFFMNDKNDDNYDLNKNHNKIYKNYLIQYSNKFNTKNRFIDYKEIDYNDIPKNIWMIYIKDITIEKFNVPEKLKNYSIKNKYFYNRIELYLLERL